MDPRQEDAIHNERHIKVICIGAGASGLCLAYKLQRSFRNYTLTIYEKNQDISGTWYENRYPGCACDVPSHNYVYSFEPKLDWSSVYASSAEICTYFQSIASKYNLWKYIKTSQLVTQTKWIEETGQWQVKVTNQRTGQADYDWCHILVHATGYLNKPDWPKIPGWEDFKGIKLQSAAYEENISLNGKEVILIGAGSSAIQILPAIQPIVKRVKIFIRSPTWLLPDISTEAGKFSQQQLDDFIAHPERVQALRQDNERTMNSIFTMYLRDIVLQDQCRELLKSVMEKAFQDDEMEKRLIPTFSVGCKRVVPSGFRYLQTLKKENVKVIYGEVASITASGCISDNGHSHGGDIIICATGFDTSYIPNYPILGPGGRNLQAEWARKSRDTWGLAFANSQTRSLCWDPQADYICSFIDRFQTETTIHSMAPTREACADFKAHVALFMRSAVWTDNCRNSHNNHQPQGRVPTTWPGSTLHYLEALREPRFEHWRFNYRGNRFAWLGNGISQVEWDPTTDLAYYIREQDDVPWTSRWKRNLAIAKTGSMPPRVLHRQPKLAARETT